jgi:predicted DNA-binding antitoxin AbrB/MazE fold protein
MKTGKEVIFMTQTLDAVFKDGSFKPLNNGSLPFAEGQRVKLTVETPAEAQDDLIELVAQIYDGLTEEDVNEVERLALDRRGFFDRPTS